MNSNIKVFVRVRPLLTREKELNIASSVQIRHSSVVVREKCFNFDTIFNEDAQQQEVFDTVAAPILAQYFDGFSGTIFAYGQTASGKTYTLSDNGVIQRTIEYIFDNLDESKELSLSYYEIYNEYLIDLLFYGTLKARQAHNGLLMLREADEFYIENLTILPVKSRQSAARLIKAGLQSRQTSRTCANDKSSRSHAILTFYLQQREDDNIVLSKLSIVDLAGSERIRTESVNGKYFKEMVGINQGLLCLGNVISALNEKRKHIPYRNSKLTRVLQDSIGGSAQCAMIACISPAGESVEETISTLIYAGRAKSIVNLVRKKVITPYAYNDEVIKLQEENKLLKDYIESLVFQRKEDILQYDNVLHENIELKSQIGLLSGEDAASLKESIQENYLSLTVNNNFYTTDQMNVISQVIDSKLELLQKAMLPASSTEVCAHLKELIIVAMAKNRTDFADIDSIAYVDGDSIEFPNTGVELLMKGLLLLRNSSCHSPQKAHTLSADIIDYQYLLSDVFYHYNVNFEVAYKYAEYSELREYLRFKDEGYSLEQDYRLLEKRLEQKSEQIRSVPYQLPDNYDDQAEVIELSHDEQANVESLPCMAFLKDESPRTLNNGSLMYSSRMAQMLQDVQKKVEQMSLGQLEQYVIDRTAGASAEEPIRKYPYHSPESARKAEMRDEITDPDFCLKPDVVCPAAELYVKDLAADADGTLANVSEAKRQPHTIKIQELDDKYKQLANYYYKDEEKVKEQLQNLIEEQKLADAKKQRTPHAVAIKSCFNPQENSDFVPDYEAFKTPQYKNRREQETLIPTQPRTPLSQRLLKRRPLKQ